MLIEIQGNIIDADSIYEITEIVVPKEGHINLNFKIKYGKSEKAFSFGTDCFVSKQRTDRPMDGIFIIMPDELKDTEAYIDSMRTFSRFREEIVDAWRQTLGLGAIHKIEV